MGKIRVCIVLEEVLDRKFGRLEFYNSLVDGFMFGVYFLLISNVLVERYGYLE